MGNVTDLLDRGIAAKRTGDYELALQYYAKARSVSPLDVRIYNNTFRIHFGLERYEDALRNLLIICSLNRIDRLIEKDMLNSESRSLLNEFRGKFRSSNLLYKTGFFSSVKFHPELIWEAIKKDELLNDLILRADNLTYYIGHSYIGLFPLIKTTHHIPEDGYKNLPHALLGNQTGNDLREHKTAGLFYCIGFIFAHMNINLLLKNKDEVIEYFLNPKTQLDCDIDKYKDFLHNHHQKKNVVVNLEPLKKEIKSQNEHPEFVKIFQEKEFTTLVQKTNATFKLPNEEDDIFYLLAIIPADEGTTGIGIKKQVMPQHWELTDEKGIQGKPYSIFQMWGAVPLLNLGGDYDLQQSMIPHEGKKIAVPKSEVLSIVSHLNRASPYDFSYENLKRTNVLKDSLK